MPKYYEEDDDPNLSAHPSINTSNETVDSTHPRGIQSPSITNIIPIPAPHTPIQATLADLTIQTPTTSSRIPIATCVTIESTAAVEAQKILDAEKEFRARQQLEQRDADLAFALQQQMQYEEEYNLPTVALPRYTNTLNAGASRVHIANNDISPTLNDDEEYARTLNFLEQERASEQVILQQQQQQQQHAQDQRRPSFIKRTINFFFPLIFMAVLIYMILYWFTPYLRGRNPFDIFGKGADWGDVWEEGDPTPWRLSGNKRTGLELQVLNACTEDWDIYLETAVNDWNESPSLDLTVVRVDIDRKCYSIRGKLKVCNDDYGVTSWVGVNEVIIENGFIIASTARMNENYMAKASAAKRQYTMCHEIGHGLGLPHTDENFFNADLGNCLDYTNNPEKNKQPDQMNFNTLIGMYGSIPGKIPELPDNDTEGTSEIATTTDLWDKQDFKIWKHAKNGLSLVIINALTSDWFPYFDLVFEDWNQAPALDLVAVSTPADPDCEPVFQSMKVCNGNYGDTEWIGINEMVLENDEIIMSTAKMNDFHLESGSHAERRYTLCHEIGHGFGLPHSDEDHLNANTGNCLDYTNDPEANIGSGAFNWERLEQMYGVFGVAKEKQKDSQKDKEKDKQKDDKNKNDRRFLRPWDLDNPNSFDSFPRVGKDKWELVEQSEFGETHVAKLGEGIQMIAQVFYA